MATPIGSPRVPSTVGSSLVTPVARDVVEPDDSAHASRCTAPASHASLARSASLLASLPAEDDQRAQHHATPLPCSAAAAFATPGTMHAGMLPASATARLLPLLPAFSASAHPVLCPFAEIQRALGPSVRAGRPWSTDFGPGVLSSTSEQPGAPHVSVATITAADHGGAAPANDNGGRLTGPRAVGALVDEAIGSEASARIAADILAIAQGVTSTQADLDILRNGVSDITEALENKIRDMWELLQAELRKERELFMQFQDSFRERRISDHETLEDHFAKLTSMVNDRLIEFDERIHHFNEKRAGSLSMQLAETIRHIKQYPDALRQIHAEARVAAVEQSATHRIEVIRSEMSRALYDHKESNRAHIDQLTVRIQHLENAHVGRGGSDRSTPSRPERTQFFDISDHDGDIPRPADLPPVPGVHSNESLTNILAKVTGKIILLSPFDRIMAKRQPHFRGDRLIRPFLPQMPIERLPVMFRASGRIQSMKLLELAFDLLLKLEASWYDAMLGRTNLIGSGAGAPILHSETGTFTLAPNTSITATLRPAVTTDAVPPMPTFNARTSVPAPSAAPPGAGGPPHGGGGSPGGDGPTTTGVHMAVVSEDMGIMGLAMSLVAVVARPVAHLVVRLVVVALLAGVVRPMADPPSIRPTGRPSGNDTFQCERCTGTFPTTVRRPCISCRFSCCNGCCRDPLRICLVCLERQTGNPPGPNDSGPGGPKGDGSLSDAKKAKCKSFRLDPEPEPAQLRRWIVDVKERVANAFAYDPGYALSWVEIPDGTRYEDLLDECKYGMLENECNSAFRECVKSIALKNKIQTETERMHTINRRLGSRQILWLLYDFLRPHVTGDSTFKLVDLMKTTIDRFTHGSEQERLEAFSNRWDHVLAGISVDRPEDPVLCALFYEQVREFRCLELDMQLWDRDVSVRNYAYLRTVCVNAITTWRRRRNQEKMYTATRSSSAQRRYAERESVPKELAETLVAQTILPEAMTASSIGDFAFACAASFDMACPSVKRKTVSFGNTETRVIESSFPEPNFGPVNRERNLNYSWPEDIRGLNSAREKRRAHMKAVLWREQVLLDDVDAKTLGNDACVLELKLSQRSACEVFAAAVKSIKRVRRLMLDSGCGIDLIGLGDLSHEERDLIVQNAKISLRTAMRIDGLDELIEAYVLESTPSLLSLGKRCKELGYRFIWEPFCDPIFFDPRGKRLKVDVINNIPYLAPSETEVVAGRPDLPRVYPVLPAPIIIHEKVVAAGEEPVGELDDIGELDIDMPGAKSVQKDAPDDAKKVPYKSKHQSPPDEPRARDLREEAKSIRFEKFGEHVTIDTMVLHGLGNRGNNGETDAVVFYDLATEWLESVPVKGRTNADTLRAFQQVFGDLQDVNSFSMDVERRYAPSAIREIYCDKAREFISTCKKVGISVKHSTPGMPRTNAIAESKVKLVLHGARVALRQAGLSAKFWPYACKHFCHARNIELREGQSAYALRFNGTEFDGQVLPFGCLVDFYPTPARKQTRRSQRDEVVLGDGEEYALPAPGDDGLIDVEVGFDDDDYLEWIDDGGDDRSGSLQGTDVDHRLSSYQRPSKFSPTSKPGIFLGYHFENEWGQVKKIYCSPKERWTFPMLSTVPKPSERLDASDMLDLEDIDEIFALDESTRMTDEEGSIGESPDPWKLSTVRISNVQYKDKSPVTIYETGYAFGKTRLMQLWTGTVEFFDDGFAPPKKKLPPYHGSEVLEGEGGLRYRQNVPRSERAYKGSRKPNSIDSESWRSMNRAEREGYVEAERREAESHAMSREDSRDAAPVDIAFDSDYESGAERHDKDYWYHDVAAGTITRFHVIERRARFNPTSVKDCPVDPATLTDVRMTMAMTDGTEFTLQDSWRLSDVRSLPCRWTGKTVFVIGSSAKTQIKVRTSLPNKDGTERRVQTANGYYGHALRAKGRIVVPAKSRACVVTDLEFEPPGGMSARLQPLRGSGLDVCPAMYTYNEGATQSGVDVLNPTDSDITIEPGQDVAVVQFYTSVLAAVELDFTAEDVNGDVSMPVESSDDGIAAGAAPAMSIRPANLAKGWELMASKIKLEPPSSIKRYLGCEHVTFSHTVPSTFDPRSYWTRFEEPKKAFPELTFGDRDTSVAQGSVGPREIRMIKYDMRSFMEQCVSRHVELCGPKYKASLRSADTPFLDESRPEFDTNPDRPAVNRLLGHSADTPVPPGKGVLGDCAAAVLMKILYGARMGRYDLIRPVQALASLITKWDGLCDKKLHRLVCYINSTLDLNLYGWIGDAPEMLELVLYCDADLAGDMGYSSSSAEQRWLRTDTSIKHNDLAKLSPTEMSRETVNPAEAVKFFKGFLQLRPTLSFLPGSFLAIKALNRFPTLDSLKEQAMHLENDRKEHGYDLPAVDANGIGEVAAFRNEDDDGNTPLMRGWVSFMKALADTYPGRCVSIDDTLNWGASTPMAYEDGASQITIHPTDGWVYVPAMNSDIYDPQETFLHGLFGEDYVTDDYGSHEPCVWVTGNAPEAAGTYASGTYLGGGYWFQVMICVSRTMVNSHSRTTKKLGGSQKQIRVGTRFLELCGIAFRPFRLMDDRENGVSTSPSYVVHGHRFLSADGTKAVAWHPWMEASPIDPRILKLLGDIVAHDNVEFADLTIQGGSTTQQIASTETEQPGAAAADDQATAGSGEATERITVDPSVLRRNHWMPDSYGTSDHATVGGRYALLSELQSSSYRIELAPFFQLRAPILGEEGSQGLPKPSRLETIAGGPSKEWEAWCKHYRKAYIVMLGNFGYMPAKSIKGIQYDEDGTTDIISAPVWSPADALVAISIHGIRAVTTMASTIAFGGAPPTIKPAVPSKPQRFVVMHDGLLTFRAAKSWHDGEMNAHLKSALTSFGFPESEVRVQAFDEGYKLKDMIDTLALMQSDTSIPPSNVHILILWRGEDLWKLDQGWSKLTGDIDLARSQYAKSTARDALEEYNTIYGSVSFCGPVSPSMGYLPTLPGHLFEKYREEMRMIWDTIRRSNFLTLSFDAILEGLPFLRGYHIMHESKTIGVLCTRICSMFTLAALARFPSYGLWDPPKGAVKAIVHSTVQDLIEGADRGPDHGPTKTVDMSQLGFDEDDDEDMAGDIAPAATKHPVKQEPGTLADLPGVRHPDPIVLPATPVPGQAMPVSPGLAPAATNNEESSSSSDDDEQQGDGDTAMPEAKKEESDEEFNELLEEMTDAFEQMPTPRDAERTVAANRDAARPPAVPTIPVSAMKKPKPIGGEEAAGPTTENRQSYAHCESQVSEAEARREQAAKMKAHIAEVAKGATGVENAEHLRSIADGLARIMDPNISDDNVFQGAMYPPGDYALDAVTNRLAQGRRRVESNSNLIREMASDRFTPVLINRDTGETVSAIDARWTPEYGNRGELEAKVGAIISNLDAVVASMSTLSVFHPHIPSTYGMARSLLNTYQSLQIAIRHRGMGAMSFEQMVFKPEDLEVPTPDDWPELIAPTPGKVIQSMRVALVNNTAARLTREDLKLPPGFAMQRRVTEFRKPDEDPVQSLMGLTDDLSYGTTSRTGDDRLSQFQRSVAVQLRNTAGFIASEFQKHARSIAASSSRRSDASGAMSSLGEGAADNDLPSTEPASVASERATTPPPPNVEDDDDSNMEDDTVDQKPEQKHEEDAEMGSGQELQDEVPGKAPPPAARTAENPPEHGVRSSSANVMKAQGAVLSGARGPDIDIDPASTAADQAASDPRNCRIEGPGIKATTIHRPDQMPERGLDSIAPVVQYEMSSVPIALPDFVVPRLDMGIDDSVHGRLVSATCLPPTDEQRKFSRRRFAMLSSNQTVYLNVALHKKPVKGDHDSFLRPESYEDCRNIHDAVRAYNAREAKYRSVGGTSVSCSRLLIDDAQNIPAATIPDAGMINLVRKLMFRVLTQTKEYPSPTAGGPQNRPQDRERGIPLYSHFDQSGIIAFDVIPMYMEREREYMKANAGEASGRILLQTNVLDENDEPSELALQCIMEIARTDNNRMFEFFYSTINDDGRPQFVGIRCQHGPFVQLAQDHYVSGERKRNVARHHPQYGWGCATIREFFGYMSDCNVNPPKGQLFLTLLPYAPGSGNNNEWEEVYMNVRMNPKRETLSNTASTQSMLPEGLGSNRMIVFAIDLHMVAAGINPINFHPRGYYAIKDSIPLACMPIAYFMDSGSLVFNTAFKYIGGTKFGTGPERGKHQRETWPLASFDCPMCGASFPVGLHMCHSCTKPIHYPDGMFYADPVNPFQVEYYGSHAVWLNELIERNKLTEFQLHEYPAIKQLRNFPVSRSLAEDHRQTAFFRGAAIKCTAVDTSPTEVACCRDHWQEARCGVEDFFNSQSIECATTIVKHFGAVFATCREKPLCYYARWSIHCQRAYRVCLSRGYLSPFYTGETIEYTVDPDMAEKIRLAHLPLQNANLEMRRRIRLSTEFDTLDEFRATITDTQKYQRYMRVDSESLSALLAKVTLTTCYGIPIKGEPGYISGDEEEEIEGAAAATKKPKGKGKGDDDPNVQAINWRELDPLGRKLIPHHADPRFAILEEGNTALLDDPDTPDETRKEFKEFVRDHAHKIKECFDEDRETEKTFFTLVEGVKGQLPDAKSTDPILMKRDDDVFEAMPDELEEPDELFDVAARQAQRRSETPQRRVQVTAQRQTSIPEAHTIPVPPEEEDEDDSELERVNRPDPKPKRRGREHFGGIAPETNPPPPREMPPPSNLPTRKTQRLSGYGAAHPDGETLRVSGRAPYSDQMKLPSVLRMRTRLQEPDLDNPTIEEVIRMYHSPNTLPILRKKAASVIIAMNANPDDDQNMKAAGVTAPNAANAGTGGGASPESTSATTQERINPKFPAPSNRTASNPPSKVPRDDKWAPSIVRPAPGRVIPNAEARGRTQQRVAETTDAPPPPPSDTASSEPRSRTMGPAKETTAKGKSRTGSNVAGLIDGEGLASHLDVIREAIRGELKDALSEVKQDIRGFAARVDNVESQVTRKMQQTINLLDDMTQKYTHQGDILQQLQEANKEVNLRLERLEKGGGSSTAGSTIAPSDSARKPAPIIGGWDPDASASDTKDAVLDVLKSVEAPIDTATLFVPGVRRGYAILPIDEPMGETFEQRRTRVQEVISKVRGANIQLGSRSDGTIGRDSQQKWGTEEAGPGWVDIAAIAKATRTTKEAEGGKMPGQIWAMAWNVGGLTADNLLKLLDTFDGSPDLNCVTLVLVQEIICDPGGCFLDDTYLWSQNRNHLQRLLQNLETELAEDGLHIHPTKTAILYSQPEGGGTFQIGDATVPCADHKTVIATLGSPITFGEQTAAIIAEMNRRGRQSFAKHKSILLARTGLKARMAAYTTLVRSAALYADETWPVNQRILKAANSLQAQHLRRMLHIERRPTEQWADWHIRSLRMARLHLQRGGWNRWSTYILQQIWSLWGHMARGGAEVNAMVQWKNLDFWRQEQRKPRSSRVNHAAGFNPEADVERALESIGGTRWGEAAQDRAHWQTLSTTFVERYDVPWATGKQTSIQDNLTPNSHRGGRAKRAKPREAHAKRGRKKHARSRAKRAKPCEAARSGAKPGLPAFVMVKRAAKCMLCSKTRALREVKKESLLEAAKAAAKKTVKLCETCATKLSHALTAKRKAMGDGDV
ncbi:Clec16a [Symbiodinium sp. CCMP2592]|nr:Clec16a [Symbiodinium sp. CCMP2592]